MQDYFELEQLQLCRQLIILRYKWTNELVWKNMMTDNYSYIKSLKKYATNKGSMMIGSKRKMLIFLPILFQNRIIIALTSVNQFQTKIYQWNSKEQYDDRQLHLYNIMENVLQTNGT